MALFGKKKEQPVASCCEGCNGCTPQNMEKAETAKTEGPTVKILGSGCAKCNALEVSTKAALEQVEYFHAVLPSMIYRYQLGQHLNNALSVHTSDSACKVTWLMP